MIRGHAYLVIKRILEFTLTLITIPLWLPLIVLCAVMVKIDSKGPIFFRQMRTGMGGRRFEMYKFRTMVSNAEEIKKDLTHLNELQWPDFKITNDPRITRIGRILRKTSLDELPQLINVFLGNMSLVGPRPTSFTPDTYRLWQTERLDVAPGLTGLWQLLGRGETEFAERLRLDIFYIEHRSLYVDMYILFHTFLVVLKQRGAH